MKNIYLLFLTAAIIVIGGLFVVTKGKSSFSNQRVSVSEVISVSASEFAKLANNDEAFLLDVHIPEQSHLPKTDAFIPYNDISQNLDKLPQNKDTQILVYCRSGSMSKQAALELQKLGYANVVDLAGGLDEYKEAYVEVTISPATQDLGTIIYGDVAKTQFTLTNFTPDDLSITRVSTSCGCTSAEVDKQSLAPYDSTTVHVSFDPAVHKDDTDLGELIRTIYVDTDNPNFKQVTSSITANVIRKVGD